MIKFLGSYWSNTTMDVNIECLVTQTLDPVQTMPYIDKKSRLKTKFTYRRIMVFFKNCS